ncbi:MAG: hypothetical protein ACR2QR_01675 [Woeseiaceae bacterium]
MHTIEISDDVMSFLNEACHLGESADDLLKRLLLTGGQADAPGTLPGKGNQDTESGAEACEFGLAAAGQIADKLGAEPIVDDPANLFRLGDQTVLIKTRRTRRGVVSIPQNVFDRFDTLLAAIATAEPGVFDVYELACTDARELSYAGSSSRGTPQRRLSIAKIRNVGSVFRTVRLDVD